MDTNKNVLYVYRLKLTALHLMHQINNFEQKFDELNC